jgi:hypothetical protein
MEVNAAARGGPKPTVIQLLGDKDDVVTHEDSKDVAVTKDFLWVTVGNTDHAGLIDLKSPEHREERTHKIQLAFGDAQAVATLTNSAPRYELRVNTNVTHVTFIMHGIRDWGDWKQRFQGPLTNAFRQKHTDHREMHVDLSSYGFFGMGPFLLSGKRHRNVRWFVDRYTEDVAKYPNLEEVDYVGHSNGSFILANALDRYRFIHIKRVAVMGSVVPCDYPWEGRVGVVRNYVGETDYVVAIFPRLFEWLGIGDIGSSGFNGFARDFAQQNETKYIRGGHGGALVDSNIQSVVDFLIEGTTTNIPTVFVATRPGRSEMISHFFVVYWMVILAVIVALGLFGTFLGGFVFRLFARNAGTAPLRIIDFVRTKFFLLWFLAMILILALSLLFSWLVGIVLAWVAGVLLATRFGTALPDRDMPAVYLVSSVVSVLGIILLLWVI